MKVRKNPVLRYTPLGAAREVTGSCHFLEFGRTKVLTDCGMFQGNGNHNRNFTIPNGIKPSEIDFIVLTHAHLDHCGRLPYFVKNGYRGRILCTEPTKPLAELVMRDSAKIMLEDSKRHRPIIPLYDLDDVDAVMRLIDTVSYGEQITLNENVSVTFYDAGHILGSAYVNFAFNTGFHTSNMLFSGDLGNRGKYLVTDPALPRDLTASHVFIESTYGSRLHKSFSDSIQEFYQAINETFERGGNVYIPTLAVERAQELMFIIREGIKNHSITSNPRVVLDSPMAIDATNIFRAHYNYFNDHAQSVYASDGDIFSVDNLEFSDTRDTSVLLNDVKSGMILLAGSGMCNGGRIIHHLKHSLPNPKNSVIFTSYAPPGTLARKIINIKSEMDKLPEKRKGPVFINIFGDDVKVNANLYTINGFSGHADQSGLVDWLSPLAASGHLRKLFIVHGNHNESMIPFAGHLVGAGYNSDDIKLKMPELAEPIIILK